MATTPDELTILRARGRRLTKLVRADGTVEGYDSARHFDLFTAPVPDLASLVALLQRLTTMPNCAVVRGAIADRAGTRRVRRLLHPDPETGDTPTLQEARRAWVALDLDGLPLPADCNWRNLHQCGAVARAMLPAAFQETALVVAATSSHGFKPGARLRVWALLDTPLSGAELAVWFRGTPCDTATFRTVQPIYTAAPIFERMHDPLPCRLVVLPGRERAVCPSPSSLVAPPPRIHKLKPVQAGEPGAGRYIASALARAAVAVASATVSNRHRTAIQQSWGLAGFVAAGLLTENDVVRIIDGALQQAGKEQGEGAAIATWAVAHRREASRVPA